MIIAVAGRRIDAPDAAAPRFPLDNVAAVRERIRALLKHDAATAVVCSAACGADLITLSVAGELGLRRKVVLPFERSKFRESSVADRPGDWGPRFDQILDEVQTAGDLIILPNNSSRDPYEAACLRILDEAIPLAKNSTVEAVVVWDGKPRGERDYTAHFAREARRRGLDVVEVSTTVTSTRHDGGAA